MTIDHIATRSLIGAVRDGDVGRMTELVKKGADLNWRSDRRVSNTYTNVRRDTLLDVAIEARQEDSLRFLLQQGIRLSPKRSAFIECIGKGWLNGARVFMEERPGLTAVSGQHPEWIGGPIHTAMEYLDDAQKQHEIIQMLLKRPGRWKAKDALNVFYVLYWGQKGPTEMSFLQENGINIAAILKKGKQETDHFWQKINQTIVSSASSDQQVRTWVTWGVEQEIPISDRSLSNLDPHILSYLRQAQAVKSSPQKKRSLRTRV